MSKTQADIAPVSPFISLRELMTIIQRVILSLGLLTTIVLALYPPYLEQQYRGSFMVGRYSSPFYRKEMKRHFIGSSPQLTRVRSRQIAEPLLSLFLTFMLIWAFKYEEKPPTPQELERWMQGIALRIPASWSDDKIDELQTLINKASDAADLEDVKTWNQYRRQAEALIKKG